VRARTHVWIAYQAANLLEGDTHTAVLATLLRAHPKEMWLGSSWLPDVCFGDVNTAHVCRSERVTVHDILPLRIRGLYDDAIAHVGRIDGPFPDSQAALAFFILGHYVADANCPLHVDPRVGAENLTGRIPSALHHELEAAWEEWFVLAGNEMPVLGADEDSPLSVISATAMTRFAASPPALAAPVREAIQIVERARRLARTHIPEGCASLQHLQRALGPQGFEMLATEVFSCAIADVAGFWRAAWLRAAGGKDAPIETETQAP